MEGPIVVVVLLLLVLITLLKGIRLVPQGSKWVVQRLGKYHTSLKPGLNIIVPYIDNVAYKVSTKDIVLDIPSQEVITLDNVVIVANAVAYINIVAPEKPFTELRTTSWRSALWCRPRCVLSLVR